MMKLKLLLKRNLYLFITLVVLVASLVFAGVIFTVFNEENKVDETSVGFIYLGNSSETQYQSILEREISSWKNNAEYQIQFQGYVVNLDLNWFSFDVEKTIDEMTNDVDNLAYFTLSNVNKLSLNDLLRSTFTPEIIEAFDLDLFIEQINSDLQKLYSRKTYELSEFLDASLAQQTIDSTTITNLSNVDVNAIIEKINTIEIPEQGRFSLLDQIDALGLTNEQMSIIASGLQGVILNTNFNGFIFEQYTKEPLWVKPGHHVRILRVNQFDFTFFNEMDYGFTLSIEKVNDTTLSFTLHGIPYITTYTSESLVAARIPYQTIYNPNDALDITQPGILIEETETEFIYRLLVQPGIDGEIIFFYRTITKNASSPITIKLFDEQYLPVDEIYEERIVEKVGE
jgi:hypothetical protein